MTNVFFILGLVGLLLAIRVVSKRKVNTTSIVVTQDKHRHSDAIQFSNLDRKESKTTTHATTKYKWTYTFKNGETEYGAFMLPIGEEDLAESWFKQIIETYLLKDEKFDRTSGSLKDFGNDQKLR